MSALGHMAHENLVVTKQGMAAETAGAMTTLADAMKVNGDEGRPIFYLKV